MEKEEERDGHFKKLVPFSTYAKLVEGQRRQLEREIQSETQALALTKRYIAEAEHTHVGKLQKQYELDQKFFNREVERLATLRGEEQLAKRIEKDKRAQVCAIINKQIEYEKLQEADAKKKQLEGKLMEDAKRAWWRQKLEKVRLSHEQRRQAVADKIESKRRRHEQMVLEKQEKLAEARKKPPPTVENAEVHQPVEDDEEIVPKTPPQHPEKLRMVLKSPRPLRLMSQETHTSPQARREEQKERKEMVDRQMVQKIEDHLAKKREINHRREEFFSALETERREIKEQQEKNRHMAHFRRNQMLEENQRQLQHKVAQQKQRTPPLSTLAADGRHCEAAQKYMRLKTELAKRRDKMRMSKHWDMSQLSAVVSPGGGTQRTSGAPRTARGARGEWDDSECGDDSARHMDAGAARLQALYDQYVKDKPTPRGAINYDRLDGAKKQRVFGVAKVRCGLCEQAYVVENLPGITTRATIGKLRDKWRSQSGEVQVEERSKGFSGLYDKVALCALCFQFVQENKDA